MEYGVYVSDYERILWVQNRCDEETTDVHIGYAFIVM